VNQLTDQEDKKQIGLTSAGDEALKSIASEFFGGSGEDAYRFAISYALAAGFTPEDAPASGYQTKYAFLSTLEAGGAIQSLIRILEVGDASRPAATAERLAEVGVTDLARRLQGSESMVDILEGLVGTAPNAVSEED
jgi:hypothetical protein